MSNDLAIEDSKPPTDKGTINITLQLGISIFVSFYYKRYKYSMIFVSELFSVAVISSITFTNSYR